MSDFGPGRPVFTPMIHDPPWEEEQAKNRMDRRVENLRRSYRDECGRINFSPCTEVTMTTPGRYDAAIEGLVRWAGYFTFFLLGLTIGAEAMNLTNHMGAV